MRLSQHQKLRLQQLGIPRWELRQHETEQPTETPSLDSDSACLNNPQQLNTETPQLKALIQHGETPSIFWLLDEESLLPSKQFLSDVSIAINGVDTGWIVYLGSDALVEDKISSQQGAVMIHLSEQFKSIQTENSEICLKFQLPITTVHQAFLKKQLCGAIYQSL